MQRQLLSVKGTCVCVFRYSNSKVYAICIYAIHTLYFVLLDCTIIHLCSFTTLKRWTAIFSQLCMKIIITHPWLTLFLLMRLERCFVVLILCLGWYARGFPWSINCTDEKQWKSQAKHTPTCNSCKGCMRCVHGIQCTLINWGLATRINAFCHPWPLPLLPPSPAYPWSYTHTCIHLHGNISR